MRAGPLDRRIRIEQRSGSPDPVYGTPAVTWSEFATVWAQVQEVLPSKSESQDEGIKLSTRPARVRIRYLAGVTSDMRIVYLDRGNRLMQITAPPAELGRGEGLELMVADFSTQGDAP